MSYTLNDFQDDVSNYDFYEILVYSIPESFMSFLTIKYVKHYIVNSFIAENLSFIKDNLYRSDYLHYHFKAEIRRYYMGAVLKCVKNATEKLETNIGSDYY